MCPACLATATLIVAGVTTTGGMAVALTKKLLPTKQTQDAYPSPGNQKQENRHE